MYEIPTWTGQTEDQRAQIAAGQVDPRWVENMVNANAAGTLPQPQQIEAARQETAQTLNTPYTPTTNYYQPQGRNYGNDSVDMSGTPGRVGSTGGAAPMTSAGAQPGYFDPMGQSSVGGYSTADHQRLGRMAGYTGEYGGGKFEAAMAADPGLRQRFNEGVGKFSQQATSANPNSWMQSLFPTGQTGSTFTMPGMADSGSWMASDPLTQALQQLTQGYGGGASSWGNPGAQQQYAPTLGAVMGLSSPSSNPLQVSW